MDLLPVRILCLGNPLWGDDGVGPAAHALLAADPPVGVSLIDGGTGGLNLLHWIEGARRVVVVDAVRGGGDPGTLYRVPLHRLEEETPALPSSHALGLLEVLAMGRAIWGGLPPLWLLGIEAAAIADFGADLSPPVAARLPDLLRAVREEVSRDDGD